MLHSPPSLKVLSAIGAICAIVVFIDRYVFEIGLAQKLLIPISVPIDLIVIFVIILSLVFIFLRMDVPQLKIRSRQLENNYLGLRGNLQKMETEKEELKRQLDLLREELNIRTSLRSRVLAVLSRKENSEYGILSELKMDPYDSKIYSALMDILGELVSEGKVEGGSTQDYYRLVKQKQL